MGKEDLYQDRVNRIKKAIAGEPVEQVPLIYMASAFSPRFLGHTVADTIEDPEVSAKSHLNAMNHFDSFDGLQMAGANPAPLLAGAWLSRVKLPGRELPADSLWQVEEKERMKPEDYDYILYNGFSAFMESFLPQVVDMELFISTVKWNASNRARVKQMYREEGYVLLCDTGAPMITIPFDKLSGGRSLQNFVFDLYRTPDKVEEVMKIIHHENLANIKNAPDPGPDTMGGLWVGGWRCASAMLAPKLWERFVWPYIVETVEAVINKGFVPILHWDQDWSRDLERLNELPSRKVILAPDGMTDVRKFRQIVGDRMALMGDTPPSLFSHGTPEDVYNYIRDLVRDIGTTSLLLCPGCDAPINTKPENMEAFVKAGKDYGK